jgi:hypothetical protein
MSELRQNEIPKTMSINIKNRLIFIIKLSSYLIYIYINIFLKTGIQISTGT